MLEGPGRVDAPLRRLPKLRGRQCHRRRRHAHGGAVGEHVAIDFGKVDPDGVSRGNRCDGILQTRSDTEPAGKAVGRAERERRENRLAADQGADRGRYGPVSPADDDQFCAVGQRLLHGSAHL